MAAKRLLVDMDGTLARFHDQVNYLERMFEKDFFRTLEPFENMVSGIRQFMKEHPDVEVYVVSAKVIGEPPYCEDEKNAWLDEHLPEIDRAHRLFTDMGHSKAEYIPGGVTKDDYLLDDYNKGLNLFLNDGGSGIKCHNNINQRGLGAYGGSAGRLWTGAMVHTDDQPEMIAAELAQHMGLEYDLNKVLSGYKDIAYEKIIPGKPIKEYDKSFVKHLTKTNLGRFETMEVLNSNWNKRMISYFENPLNAIRYLSGRDEYKEFRLVPNNSPNIYATAQQLQAVCSNFYPEEPDFYAMLKSYPTDLANDVLACQKTANLPTIGQINFLAGNGTVGYSMVFHDADEMKKVVDDCRDCGEPITVDWFIKPKPFAIYELTDFFSIEERLEYEHNVPDDRIPAIAGALLIPHKDRTEEQTLTLTSAWHDYDFKCSLKEFLGMTDQEYQKFLLPTVPSPTANASLQTKGAGVSLDSMIASARGKQETPVKDSPDTQPSR